MPGSVVQMVHSDFLRKHTTGKMKGNKEVRKRDPDEHYVSLTAGIQNVASKGECVKGSVHNRWYYFERLLKLYEAKLAEEVITVCVSLGTILSQGPLSTLYQP